MSVFGIDLHGLHFAWPWVAVILPLPWLLAGFAPVAEGAALRVVDPALVPSGATRASGRVAGRIGVVAALLWSLLLLAAMRPQWVGPEAQGPVSGRELMIAFDVSASMATADLRTPDGRLVERLAAARSLADDFVAGREGDRIGLIVFGDRAFLHTPLTFDLTAVRAALAEVDVGLAGRETALGDGIAVAVRGASEHADSAKVLVLVSDGAPTAGELGVQQAVWLARREGVRIHTIGVGAAPMTVETFDKGIQEFRQAAGLDEAMLQSIANETGGTYRRATDVASLSGLYREIDAAEPVVSRWARPAVELYAWPLGLALLLTASRLAPLRRFRRVPAISEVKA